MAQQQLTTAEHRAHDLPWLRAGLVAMACVGLASQGFGLYGAIAGAVLGFFAGQGVISKSRIERLSAVAQAKSSLEDEREALRENDLCPSWFTKMEGVTGEREKAADHESVVGNRAAQRISRPAKSLG